jgi:hypothetical protein
MVSPPRPVSVTGGHGRSGSGRSTSPPPVFVGGFGNASLAMSDGTTLPTNSTGNATANAQPLRVPVPFVASPSGFSDQLEPNGYSWTVPASATRADAQPDSIAFSTVPPPSMFATDLEGGSAHAARGVSDLRTLEDTFRVVRSLQPPQHQQGRRHSETALLTRRSGGVDASATLSRRSSVSTVRYG